MALHEIQCDCIIKAKAVNADVATGVQVNAVAESASILALTNGTTVNTASHCIKSKSQAISSGNTLDVDMVTLANLGSGDGFDIVFTNPSDLAEVVAIQITNESTSVGNLELGAAAANPWLAFLKDASDKLVLKPNTTFQIQCPNDPAFALTGGSKVLRYTAAGGNITATTTIIARNA